MTVATVYFREGGLTGGASDALDSIPVGTPQDNDVCLTRDTGKLYVHIFNASSTDAESSPSRIRPDDYSTAGVWERIESPIDSAVEIGSVIAWPTDSVPSGYLECNGSAISRTTYAGLFAVLSDTYGDGDGVNTFNLPDYRGEFLRGYDNGAGIDPDAASRTDRGDGTTGDAVGTRQEDEFEAHTHNYNKLTGGTTLSHDGTAQNSETSGPTSSTGGNETRPTNVTVMWCIKY